MCGPLSAECAEGARGATEAATRLRALISPLSRLLRDDVPEPFTATQLSVLGLIHLMGPISFRELARRERLSPPMISRVVAGLEELGMVDRLSDPRDGRVCLVSTSTKGERWIRRETERRNAWFVERMTSLGSDDLERLLAALPVLEGLVEGAD